MTGNLRPVPPPDQEASSPQADHAERIRDACSARHVRLDEARPEALDLAADVLVVLHAALHGRAAATSGDRGARYFRGQLRGEHPLTLEDLARLCLDVPLAAGSALGVLAHAAGYRLEPSSGIDRGAVEAVTGIVGTSADVVSTAVRALEDGRIDRSEAQQLQVELERLKRSAASLEVALTRVAR